MGWYKRMQEIFRSAGIKNVDYRYREGNAYCQHGDLEPNQFDLVVVDGMARADSAKLALRLVRPGGWIFFDDSDVPWSDFSTAREVLLEAALPGEVMIFNDLRPFQIQANESMLIRIDKLRVKPS